MALYRQLHKISLHVS